MDADFSSDLKAWLAATADNDRASSTDRYVVDHVLKETPYEVTQVVYRRNSQGVAVVGPFVRKRFLQDVSRGQAYDQLLQAQTAGIRFEHQPLIYECEHMGSSIDVVMEYVNGVTLSTLAQSEGHGVDLAAHVMPQLCDALTELHESLEKPLIHRDVKPSNIMLRNGRVMLIDLGIAREYRAGATRDTVRYGTPGYAPPEQFGYGQTSVRSDVYALGMTLAFCLTGEEPTAELRESGFADPRIPAAFASVLVRATEFDPANRYASARDLRTAIDTVLQNQPDTVPVPGAATMPTSAPAPGSRQAHEESRVHAILNVIGRIWNVVLAILWVLMSISVIVNIVAPQGNNAQYPGWFNALLFLGLLYVPWTLLSYLLMDKRRLRQRTPFSRWTWRREVPVCLGVSVACITVVVIIYNVLFH